MLKIYFASEIWGQHQTFLIILRYIVNKLVFCVFEMMPTIAESDYNLKWLQKAVNLNFMELIFKGTPSAKGAST